ncbi:MAG: flagellar biosynthesis protein FlhF [Phycisphaerae bacterium]|nr:flagellar biosynthesis protein FlhF [Phycisphaerae bacterium]
MNLKTYRARTIGDALAEVKRDLGKDAVILHTRTLTIGGWLGLGGRSVVEVTASDDAGLARRQRPAPPAEPARRPVSPQAGARAADVRAPESADRSAAARAAAVADAVEVADRPARVAVERPIPMRPSPDRRVERPATLPVIGRSEPDSVAVGTIRQGLDTELAAIKRMVGQVLQATRCVVSDRARPSPAMPDALMHGYLRLLEGQVATELADGIVASVRDELSAAELRDESAVREAILKRIAAMLPGDGTAPIARPADGRPLTIALIGPTGVGKTTTVAKLAAAYKLRQGRRVGLITTDTYRIAAVDQLRTYAEIIGLPLKVVLTPRDMGPTCEALAGCEVVLIDTAGRPPRDAARLDELRGFIDAARPHQTHLVLSSAASEGVVLEAAERFRPIGPNRVIMTKLDEAVNYGVLMTVAQRLSLRFSFVTTGQEVPDHIEAGDPERLARLVLDGPETR